MNNDKGSLRNVNKKPGLQIWFINELKMVQVPARSYGNFFEGDCYIVLSIRENKYSTPSSDIHYWIGKTSSQDEQGAAAIFVTQIDEHLGGLPVQHREVQGYESARFRSYFKNGIIYKKGGVSSGFNHVVTNSYNVLRLLQVKGRKTVTATEVDVSWASFNNDDIFLLDVGNAILQWTGPQSNRKEKLKAVLLAQDIRDRERGGRAQIGIVEGGQEHESPELMKIMTSVLGPKPSQLKRGTPDDQVDGMNTNIIRLYHVYEQSSNLVVQEVAVQPLTQDLLLSSDCYILDQGGSCVMVWKGKNASAAERKGALNRAVGFIKAKNYPSFTRVEVMAEGGESAMFMQLFQTWTQRGQTRGLGTTHGIGKIANVDGQVKFDVRQLHARPELAAHHRMVDDASGEVKVWRIEKLELAEVKPRTYGQFYGGDCYLVLYSYQRGGQPQYILYMWQGRRATQDEITACAFQAVAVDNQYNGAPVQVRVVMGKEPRHFLAIFKGKFIIFEGGTGRSSAAYMESGIRLFQVRGTDEMNTLATEVPPKSASLNSNDVFLLKTDHICYLWYGKGCNGDERVMGRSISDVLSKQEKQVVMEGQEPHEFWISLGGKAPYPFDREYDEEVFAHSPRLFECSNQTGQFRMTEVGDVTQVDLDEDDVMLLDTWHDIFLWVGKLANELETKESWRCAQDYLRTHPAGRDPDTSITFVKQGFEPPTFTGWFNAWDPLKWSEGASYEAMKLKLTDTAAISQITVDLKNTDVTTTDGYRAPGGPSVPFYRVHGDVSNRRSHPSSPSPNRVQHFVPLSPIRGHSPIPPREKAVSAEFLIGKDPGELPAGVDSSQREVYMSDEEFQSVVGTSRADFLRLPKWRQDDLKKKAGIF